METTRQRDEELIVTTIAAHMRRKLELNRHKGDWREDSILLLCAQLVGEVQELIFAIAEGQSSEEIWREAGDVANYVGFIAHAYAHQKKKESDA